MMTGIFRGVLCLFSILLCQYAAAGSFYMTGGVGLIKNPSITNSTPIENPGTQFNATAGWNISSKAAVEISYNNMQSVTYETPVFNAATSATETKKFDKTGHSIEMSAVGIMPITSDGFALTGKLGVSLTQVKFSNPDNLSVVPSNYSKTSPLLGGGVQYQGKDGTILRLETEYKSVGGARLISIMQSVGFVF